MSARVLWRWLRRRNFLDGYCGEVLPGGEFRWFNSLSFRYLDQIRLDVIESGVLVQHLCRCWWIVISSGTSKVFSIRVTWSAAPHDWFWLQSQLRWTYRSSKMTYLLGLTGYWSKMASFVRFGVDWFGDLSRKSSPTYCCSDSSQPFYPIQLTFCLRQSPHHDQHFSLS